MKTSEGIFITSICCCFYAPMKHGTFAFVIPSKGNNNYINRTSLPRRVVGLSAFTTEGYLDSLSETTNMPYSSARAFASDEYLKTLSHIVQSSGDFDILDVNMDMSQIYQSETPPSEFLNRLSYHLAQVTMDCDVMDESTSSSSNFFVSGSTSSSITSASFTTAGTSQLGEFDPFIEPVVSTSYSAMDAIVSSSIPVVSSSEDTDPTFEVNSIMDQMAQLAIATEENVGDSIQSSEPPTDDTSMNIDKTIESLEQRREMIQKQLAQMKSQDATTFAETDITSPPSVEPVTSAPIVNNNVDDIPSSSVQESVSELSKSLKAMLSEESYSSPSTSFSFDKASGGSISNSFQSILKTQSNKLPSPSSTSNRFSIQDLRTPKGLEPNAPDMDTKSLQEFVDDILKKVNDAGESTIKTISETMKAQQMAVNQGASGSTQTITDVTSGTVKSIGEASISDVAGSIVSGIKFIATIVLRLIDAILVKVGEPTVEQMIVTAKTSIQAVVDGATSAIVDTVTGIGNLTVKDILQGLIALLIAVSKLLLAIFNMLVKYLSGKGASEWVLDVSTFMNEQSKALISKASHTAYDLTHASFTELASSIGAFSQEIGSHLVSSVDVSSDSIITTGLL
jgi:hypothetical protein